MKIAGNAGARLGRNPEIGAASVKYNLEGLGRGADSDFGEIFMSVSFAFIMCTPAMAIDLHWAFMKLVMGTGWPPWG